jgi:dienelactone hydrolase
MRCVFALVLLLAFAPAVSARAEDITLPGPDGVTLKAKLFRPDGVLVGPAVVALHGCGGPFPLRDAQWVDQLNADGHAVLLPDSFGSRGLGSQCRVADRLATAKGLRRADALAAAKWLAAQPWTPPGGVALLGWSNGGEVVLAAGAAAPDVPDTLFRALVAFYPGCRAALRRADWKPAAPLLLMIGEDDDWTPEKPCEELADRVGDAIHFVTYPGAYHDFDAPDDPVHVLTGLAFSAHGDGTAHAGTEPKAREDAMVRVPNFLEAMPARP